MHRFLFERRPSPNFQELEEVLKGKKEPKKVYFVELGVDQEVVRFITENMLGERWVLPPERLMGRSAARGKASFDESEEKFWKQYINFYYRMGYDYVPGGGPLPRLDMYTPKVRIGDDTAILSRGKRTWVEETRGVITSWEDFEKFPWEKMNSAIENYDFDRYDKFLRENLPEGMKVMIGGSLYEQVLERLLGYEGLFYSLYDQPDLVEAVFNAWGKIIYKLYQSLVPLESVGGIFHADDLGYKTATMLKPDILRKLVFPWFKRYASLAHSYGKMYWYHCCGNVLEVMEDLIEEVKIDAFHSFQDEIIPVGEFKRRYGDRIAVLGGVDMDKLARLNEEDLRKYVRGILNECMPGRFALGSGNTVANYIPVKNYLIMLEEGLRWKSSSC